MVCDGGGGGGDGREHLPHMCQHIFSHLNPLISIRSLASTLPVACNKGGTQIDLVQSVRSESVPKGGEEVHQAEDPRHFTPLPEAICDLCMTRPRSCGWRAVAGSNPTNGAQ